MFIFNLFSVGFNTLCHLIVFLCCAFFPFLKQETFACLCTKCLKQRGQNETKCNVNENMKRYLPCKKGVSSVDKKITKKCQ